MAGKISFRCLPTCIGSLPDTDPEAACRRVFAHLDDIPFWPQLPKRSPLENMYIQFAEGFPGAIVEGDKLFAEKTNHFDTELEALYNAYAGGDVAGFAVTAERAAGLHAFLGRAGARPQIVKGQVTGPISWGLAVTDRQGRGIVYDETLADAAAKLLRLKATWQESALRRIATNTVIFVDEPYLTSMGSAFVSIPPERVAELIGEVLRGIDGISGIHCCGGAEWPNLLGLQADVVSFDTYNYAQSFSLYPAEVKEFLSRGGTVAWGIVPNEEDAIARETVASLADRLGEAVAPFTRNGLPFRQVLEQALLTPSCGLASLSSEAADQALGLLTGLSQKMRQRI